MASGDMFYQSDFNVPRNSRRVNTNTFNILLIEDKREKNLAQSVAKSLLPLSYISSILAMKTFNYHKNGLKPVNNFSRIFCLFIIVAFLIVTFVSTPPGWRQTATDLPLNILSKTFTLLQTTELLYAVFIISFGNSQKYVYLYEIIDDIDKHLGSLKRVYTKRIYFSTFMMTLPPILVGSVLLVRPPSLSSMPSYITFSFVTLHGVNVTYHVILIYVQVLVFNFILRRKIRNISNPKAYTFNDDWFTVMFRKVLYDLDNLPDKNYTWFELMQIYDKISDCVYIYNKIYTTQILIMLNSWLLTTILVICRSITPALKNTNVIRTDIYYYTFINMRPFFLTKISESFIHERRKILLSLIHILVHQEQDSEYEDQIRTMLDLVQNKELILSGVVCNVNLSIMFSFAGRVISYAVMCIQNFYLTQ